MSVLLVSSNFKYGPGSSGIGQGDTDNKTYGAESIISLANPYLYTRYSILCAPVINFFSIFLMDANIGRPRMRSTHPNKILISSIDFTLVILNFQGTNILCICVLGVPFVRRFSAMLYLLQRREF